MLFPELINNWKSATCSSDTYRTTEWHSNLMVSCVIKKQGLSRAEAWNLLQSEVLLPSTSSPPFASRMVQKYLSRAIDYFYSSIALTAHRVYLKSLLDKGYEGVTREATNEAGTRFVIKISKQEAAKLCTDNTLVLDSDSMQAIRDATAAVFKKFGGYEKFFETSSTRSGKPALVCLLGHLAVVSTKIEEYLKRVGGVTCSTTPGMNPGHREPWRRMLRVLDGALAQRGETRNGLRLVDGERADRGLSPPDRVGDDEAGERGSGMSGGLAAAAAGAAVAALATSAAGESVAAGGSTAGAAPVVGAVVAGGVSVRDGQRPAAGGDVAAARTADVSPAQRGASVTGGSLSAAAGMFVAGGSVPMTARQPEACPPVPVYGSALPELSATGRITTASGLLHTGPAPVADSVVPADTLFWAGTPPVAGGAASARGSPPLVRQTVPAGAFAPSFVLRTPGGMATTAGLQAVGGRVRAGSAPVVETVSARELLPTGTPPTTSGLPGAGGMEQPGGSWSVRPLPVDASTVPATGPVSGARTVSHALPSRPVLSHVGGSASVDGLNPSTGDGSGGVGSGGAGSAQ